MAHDVLLRWLRSRAALTGSSNEGGRNRHVFEKLSAGVQIPARLSVRDPDGYYVTISAL